MTLAPAVGIVSHSKGAAYAAGFQDAWNEMVNEGDNKDLFAGEGGEVQFSLMLASHQGNQFSVNKNSTTTVNIHHDWDDMAHSDVKGDVVNIQTDNHSWIWEVIRVHSIDGFHFEAVAAIETFMEKESKGQDMGFMEAIESGNIENSKNYGYEKPVKDAVKWIYNRKEGEYYGKTHDKQK